MNNMGISTDPALLNAELPHTLIESPSVSTFLPEEEASICPLLSNTNDNSTALTFSHPLTPGGDMDSNASSNLCNEDPKGDTGSSSGSSGIGMDATENATTSIFNKHAYQSLQHNNTATQDSNGTGQNGNMGHSKDTPSFVSWNWPLIRKCTFFGFMSSLLAMCVLVVAMIMTLPKTCNPQTAWYQGGVFYEIFPASFQDSNKDGVGDLRGIKDRIDYLNTLGVTAVRLNSIFPSIHYPENYNNVTTIMEIAAVLGNTRDLRHLADSLHKHNISLILDLPLSNFVIQLEKTTILKEEKNYSSAQLNIPNEDFSNTILINSDIGKNNTIVEAIVKWTELGVDGFYIKGLETVKDVDLVKNLVEWKRIIGASRILIINNSIINNINATKRSEILRHVDLVDVHLDILNGTKDMDEYVKGILSGYLAPGDEAPWIHWSIGDVERQRITQSVVNTNVTLAATIMQLMLPGTPSLFYGDEIAIETIVDQRSPTQHMHHLPIMQWSNTSVQFTSRETLPWLLQTSSYNPDNLFFILRMIELRKHSPSIYKNAICKSPKTLQNTQIYHNHDDILIVERVYPRRNSFVSISNLGKKDITLDLTSMYYSGYIMLQNIRGEKIFFGKFKIGPEETIVVKLDK